MYPDTFIGSAPTIGPIKISPLIGLFILTLPALILIILKEWNHIRFRLFDAAFLALMGFIAVRGLMTTDSVNELGLVLAYCGYSVLVYYGSAAVSQDGRAVKSILYTLAGLTVFIIGYGLLEFALNYNLLYEDLVAAKIPGIGKYNRSGSTLAHPISLGVFLIQTAPVLLYLFARSRKTSSRLFWGVALVVSALAIEVTFTKGSWFTAGIIAAIAATLLIYRYPSIRKQVLLLIAVTLASVLLLAALSTETISQSTTSEQRMEQSVAVREYLWRNSIPAFLENPIIGSGIFNSPVLLAEVTGNEYLLDRPLAIGNLYLTILVEFGVVGSVLTLLTFILLMRQLWHIYKRADENRWLIVVFAVSIAAVMINGMTAGTLFLWAVMVVFWLLNGIIRAMYEQGPAHSANTESL